MVSITKEKVIGKINTLTDWFPKSYAGGLFGIYIQGMGLSRGAKEIPHAIPYGLVYQNRNRKDHWDWFWNIGEMTKKRGELIATAVGDDSFTDSFFKQYKKRYDAYLAHFEKCAAVSVENLSNKEMHRRFGKLYELAVAQAAYGYVVDALLTSGTEDWLQSLVTAELGAKATAEAVTHLTAPVFSTFVNDFEVRVLELAADVSDGTPEAKLLAEARRIEEKYFWVRTNYLDYKRVTAGDILDEARKCAANEKNIGERVRKKKGAVDLNKKLKEKLCTELGVSEKLRRVLRLSETFAHIQDKRKECVLRNNTLFYEALETLARRNGFDPKLVFYLTPEEFFAFLEFGKLPDWRLVSRRFDEGVLVLYFDGVSSMVYKDEIDPRVKAEHLFPNLEDIKELRGSTAFGGKAEGVVRVLRNTSEIAKFREGEILVANQTTPEFVPAMKKAAAIVTDQGGITSHASIIARELRTPCIVGVKNATKILKDGDRVEVDATNGVVKKLG